MVSMNRKDRRSTGWLSRTRLLFLAAIIAGAVFLVQFMNGNGDGNNGGSSLFDEGVTSNYSALRSRPDSLECRFYLAESAIPMGGLGLYTAIDIPKGAQAQSMEDICIYVADTPDDTDFDSHSWARDVFMGQWEGNNPRAACEGFATLFNSLPPGVATSELKSAMHVQTNAGLDRKTHPGAGAISHFYGITSEAVRDLSAGSELTIDYGDRRYEKGKKYEPTRRSPEWLRTHGMCIDNIKIQPATDPQMGRGAFAKRPLKRNTIVAPAPLQIYKHRSDFAKQKPEALFINYCFQFKGSDMMLFSYGPGVNLINHNGQNPNVFIRWSTNHMHHSQWLSLPPDQMMQMIYPGGLMLEVVALRDIAPNEELFMDYGTDWDRAWNKHVQEWKPLPGTDNYVYPGDIDRSKPFRTVEEQENDPYASNLLTVCSTGNGHHSDGPGKKKWQPYEYDWPEGLVHCYIMARKMVEGEEVYTVILDVDGDRDYAYDPKIPMEERYIDRKVPKSAIGFADKPYKSDLHLKNAFRQPIGFPDHLVPELWRTAEL